MGLCSLRRSTTVRRVCAWLLVLSGVAGVAFAAEPAATLPEEPLRVCLQRNDPPLSWSQDGTPLGFDVGLSRIVAERLNRPFAIQWFTTRRDLDSNPVT